MMEGINDIAKEIIIVLEHFETSFVDKINKNIITLLKDLSKKSQKEVKIDMAKNLNEQDISEDAKDFISAMYYYFIADEEKKKILIECWNLNEKY